jgi:hypothetical protein
MVQSDKKYRVRLVNIVSLDGHPFTAMSNDFVLIQPLDVIVEANQTASKYWFRADAPNGACGNNANPNGIKAIFHYSDATIGNPTSTAWPITRNNVERCTDES